jgi:HPt (histidine-containing phosphotransfer) domain-containing protein
VDPELDLARLGELQELLGRDVSDIVAILVAELAGALETIAGALGHGDLDEAAQAAHSARNSALMIDARPMLASLAELEAGARRNDGPAALIAHRRLRELWPGLRRRLELAGAAET